MNGSRGQRIVVKVLSRADHVWLADGRHHFLNRAAYERHRRGRRRFVGEQTRLLSVSPFADLLVALTVLFLPFWALWQVTKHLCPPAASLWLWCVRLVQSVVRSVSRQIIRYVRQYLWTHPVQHFGLAVTTWLWLLGLWVVTVVISVMTGKLGGLVAGMPLLLLAIMCWHLLRWWRERVYRPRPLPRRRVRVRHD